MQFSVERDRPGRRAGRLAPRFPIVGSRSVFGGTPNTATGTVALPGRGQEAVALVITLLMLSVITFLTIAFLAMSQRNQSAVSASLDQANARAANDAALARAQTEIMAQMLAHNDALYYDYMVSAAYNTNGPFNASETVYDPTNVNYDSFLTNRAAYSAANYAQNIANLWYDPRPPVFVVTNPAYPNSNDFRFWVDINRNGRFETNGYQATVYDNGNATGSSNFLNGEPEFIGILRNPLYPHSSSNQFIGRYAYLVLPIGKELDINYIHNFLKQAAHPTIGNLVNTSVPNNENDGFARDQGIGSWELNLAGLLDAVSPWAYESNNSGYPTKFGTYYYKPPSSIPGNGDAYNTGNAFDDAEAILHYRYGAPNYALASLISYVPSYYVSLTWNNIDWYCFSSPVTNYLAPSSYSPISYDYRPWPGGYQSNQFFDVQDLFDPNKTSSYFPTRMILAGQRTNSFDRYTFQRLLSCIAMGSSPEYGTWVYANNGNPSPRTKININYDNTAQIYASNAPYAPMPTVLTNWTPINFFMNAADLLLRSQGYTYSNYSGSNFVQVGPPIHFGVTNIPVFSYSNPGIRYTANVHRMLQLAANIYDATVSSNYPSSYGNVRHPTVFRPLFQVLNPNTTNVSLIINGYVQVTSGNDAWTNMHQNPFQDPMMVVTNVGQFNTNGNVAGVPWVVAAEKGLPEFNHYTAESSVLFTRKLQFPRYIVNGVVQTNLPPQYTNQFYCMAVTNSFGMDAWNSYPSNFRGANGIYYYFSNFVTVQFTNQVNAGYHASITNFLNIPYELPIYAGNYGTWPAAQVKPIGGKGTKGIYLMYTNANIASLPGAYFSPSKGAFYYLTNILALSNSFLPSDVSQTAWPVYNWTYTVTNHVVFALFDGNPTSANGNAVLLDFVNLGPFGFSINITNALAQSGVENVGPGSTNGNYFFAPAAPGSSMPQGVLNQIAFAETNQPFWNNLLAKGSPISSEATIQCPYTPTYVITQQTNWVVNDPLVHYTLDDLTWLGDSSPSLGFTDLNERYATPPILSIGTVSFRYAPWNQGSVLPIDMLLKDPQMWTSTNWDFPTNKLPSVGWLGRVHRGTPWQTVYFKADNPSGSTAPGIDWASWASPTAANPWETYPTNDWALVDLFTTAPNDNAATGLLSVNQTNDAAWAAVFSGVIVPTNTFGGVQIMPNNNPPPGVAQNNNYNYTNLTEGVNGINWSRANYPSDRRLTPELPFGISANPPYSTGVFHKVGDILAAPALTTENPFLTNNGILPQSCSDEIVELIPQQTLGLLKVGEPQFAIYAWGQALKPKGPPYLNAGQQNNNIYTNYEITGEVLTRTICHVVHTNGVKMVIDSYNVESGN
jgi:hypothetical protein